MSKVKFDLNCEQDIRAEQRTGDYATMHIPHVEGMMIAARPRLLRLAHLRGVAPEAIEDVVQETLTEAWQHLDHLRSPERFHAWLDGICRHMCLRWYEASTLQTRRHIQLSTFSAESISHNEGYDAEDIPDPHVIDPIEELNRQDLAVLLDRALGYLPDETRKLVELCYLAELPQREAALHLGMTISALESRLYRARRQLHEILSGDLRAEAENCGLAMGSEIATGWRETREWCTFCGRHRLRGYFEQGPAHTTAIHIRCPGCSNTIDNDIVPLGGMRSFRPVLKRVYTWATTYLEQVLRGNAQTCPICSAGGYVEFTGRDALDSVSHPDVQEPNVVFHCSSCGDTYIYIGHAVWSHAAARQFIIQHPRWIYEPATVVEYAGQSAIKMILKDLTSNEHLTLLAHYQNLQILTVL